MCFVFQIDHHMCMKILYVCIVIRAGEREGVKERENVCV